MSKAASCSEKDRVALPVLAMMLARKEAEIELALLDPSEVGSDAKKSLLTHIVLLGLDTDLGPMISRIEFMVMLDIIHVYSALDGTPPKDASEIGVNPENWWVRASDVNKIVEVTAEGIEEAIRCGNECAVRGVDGRHSLEDAAKLIAGNQESYDLVLTRLEGAALSGELPVYLPGERMRYEYAKDEHVRWFYEEAYWDDLNAWLEQNEPRVVFRFSSSNGVAPASNSKVSVNEESIYRQREQENRILDVISELGYEASSIPKWKPGKRGVKSDVRQRLNYSKKVFDLAWERLRDDGHIRDSQ